MTDTRFPERYLSDRRILRLTPAGFRFYAMSLMWSVSNRTDGHVDVEDLGLIPGMRGGLDDYSTEMERAGLWKSQGNGWLIVDFASTQTSAHELEVLETKRRNDRVSQARKRARDKAKQGDSHTDVSVTDQADDIGQEGQEGRQVQEPSHDEAETDWPEVVQPGRSGQGAPSVNRSSSVVLCKHCPERVSTFRLGYGCTTCATHSRRDPVQVPA